MCPASVFRSRPARWSGSSRKCDLAPDPAAISATARLAIAIERADEASLDDELSNDTGEGAGMEPLVIYAHPKPRIRRGEQVWAGNRKYPATTQAPLRPGIDGRVARFHLLHIESPHSQPLTIWVEPLCAEALLKWAAPETLMGYAAVTPELSR